MTAAHYEDHVLYGNSTSNMTQRRTKFRNVVAHSASYCVLGIALYCVLFFKPILTH